MKTKILGFSLGLLAFAFSTMGVATAAPMAAPDRCDICQAQLGVNSTSVFYAHEQDDWVRQVKRVFCDTCNQASDKCWACGLPVIAKTMRRLDDGRLLCAWDAKDIVTTEIAARDLWREHFREWQRTFSSWAPPSAKRFQIHLVNQDDFVREYRRQPHLHNPEQIRGFCHTTRDQDGQSEYHIYVLSGLLRNQFLAVCAHEYGHAWLREHDNPKRLLHGDTEEGFCEWLALRYMVQLSDSIEQHRIRSNNYTQGQIEAFEAAEAACHTQDVIRWMLEGVDSWLDLKEPRGVLALRRDLPESAPLAPFVVPPVLATTVPDRLMLKGIAGKSANRLALINNQSFVLGETSRVRVGTTNLLVRCLEIRESSVLIQVTNESAPRELFLGQSR